MNVQPSSRQCFLCGVENPIGLKLSFYELGDGRVATRFLPQQRHQGYPGVLHGGIASAPEIAATAFPGDRYTLRPFFRTDELSVSPMTLLRDGPGPWSWMAALSIAVVLQLIVSLTGRAEAGVYRATGTRLSELWFMSLVRTVMIGAGATALGAMAAAVWLALQPANVISAAGLWYALQPVVLFATGLLVVLPALDTLSVAGSVADRLTA